MLTEPDVVGARANGTSLLPKNLSAGVNDGKACPS
jgi:hypothetical protein